MVQWINQEAAKIERAAKNAPNDSLRGVLLIQGHTLRSTAERIVAGQHDTRKTK